MKTDVKIAVIGAGYWGKNLVLRKGRCEWSTELG